MRTCTRNAPTKQNAQDAVVFVYTRHALATLGRFDENIFPAYYEDYDMDLR
jgi:GT2 family glycosyltransferase